MLKKKIWSSFLKSLKNMGFGSGIPDPGPGVKKAPDPGYGFATLKNVFVPTYYYVLVSPPILFRTMVEKVWC
jgi:hypothetical protein